MSILPGCGGQPEPRLCASARIALLALLPWGVVFGLWSVSQCFLVTEAYSAAIKLAR
jgi:hypothetical protein